MWSCHFYARTKANNSQPKSASFIEITFTSSLSPLCVVVLQWKCLSANVKQLIKLKSIINSSSAHRNLHKHIQMEMCCKCWRQWAIAGRKKMVCVDNWKTKQRVTKCHDQSIIDSKITNAIFELNYNAFAHNKNPSKMPPMNRLNGVRYSVFFFVAYNNRAQIALN